MPGLSAHAETILRIFLESKFKQLSRRRAAETEY